MMFQPQSLKFLSCLQHLGGALLFLVWVQIKKSIARSNKTIVGKSQGPTRHQAIIPILGLTFQVINKITSSGYQPSPHQILSNPFMTSSYATLGAISSALNVFSQLNSCNVGEHPKPLGGFSSPTTGWS